MNQSIIITAVTVVPLPLILSYKDNIRIKASQEFSYNNVLEAWRASQEPDCEIKGRTVLSATCTDANVNNRGPVTEVDFFVSGGNENRSILYKLFTAQ